MSTPKDLLSFSEFKQMSTDYKSKNPGKTKSVWVAIDKLKEYIAFIEKESKAKEIDLSGMRMHMITNTDKLTSLAFSPTFKDANDRGTMPHISFDPLYSTKGKPAILSELLDDTTKSKSQSSVLNGLRPCPSNCPNK